MTVMGMHTVMYQLIVTDHVKGRTGVAQELTGWESDPEGAIRAYRELADDSDDGTTVDLVQVISTSLMSTITAARQTTTQMYQALETARPADGDTENVTLTSPMAGALLIARDTDEKVYLPVGTAAALIDRGLIESAKRPGDPYLLTDRGRVLADLVKVESHDNWVFSGTGTRTYSV